MEVSNIITLTEARAMTGYTFHARDGEIGKVKEFYFDDHHWAARYLAADADKPLSQQFEESYYSYDGEIGHGADYVVHQAFGKGDCG